jgi:predicted dinucleotide-binding enzyme
VKALNTVTASVMVDPGSVPGAHAIFVSGNDEGAKGEVVALLESFGWPRDAVVDLGDITTARGTEMYLALWIRLMGTLGTPEFNIAISRP